MAEADTSRSPSSRHSGAPPVRGPRTPLAATRTIDLPDAQGRPFLIEEYGVGRPVVFLHGLVGQNKHWGHTVDALAPRARMVLVEAPLLSMKGPRCTVEGVSAMVADVLAAAVEGPAVVVGSSFGGHVATRIALDRPELVSGLALVGASGLYEAPFEDEVEAGLLKKDVQIRPSLNWMDRKIKELFFDHARMPEGIIDEAHEALQNRGAARAMVKLSRTARKDHLGDRLHAVAAPTLIVWGRQDIVTPPRVAEDFRAGIPDARLHWIDRCGHAPMIERPEEFTAGLAAFLDELWAADAPVSPAGRQVLAG